MRQDELRVYALDQLKAQLQGLALPAKEQVNLYAPRIPVADELALDFTHWMEVALSNEFIPSDSPGATAIQRVDLLLEELSSRHDPALWSDESLIESVEWERIRGEARSVLETMCWPVAPPSRTL